MADTKISGLPQVAAFALTQEFVVNDSGVSRKITGAQMAAFVAQGTLAGGYAQVTANQTGITAATDLTGLTVTVTVTSGRRLRISASAGFSSSVANDQCQLQINEGATTLIGTQFTVVVANNVQWLTPIAIITPTAGTHTYKLTGFRLSGTGNLTMYAGTALPAFILVEDIGT
jgi:hypothetical protein